MAKAYKQTATGREPRSGVFEGKLSGLSGSFRPRSESDHDRDMTMGGRWFWDRGDCLAPPPAPLAYVSFRLGDINVRLSYEELASLMAFANREKEAEAREKWNAERQAGGGA